MFLGISDFIAAIDLGEILERMSSEKQSFQKILTQPPMYTREMLQHEHKKDVIE